MRPPLVGVVFGLRFELHRLSTVAPALRTQAHALLPHRPLCSYTVEKPRASGGWEDVASKIDQPTGALGGSSSQRSFSISGLADGLYRVKVWGRIVHPDQTVTSSTVTSAGDHPATGTKSMRTGIIAVGTPGEWLGVGGCVVLMQCTTTTAAVDIIKWLLVSPPSASRTVITFAAQLPAVHVAPLAGTPQVSLSGAADGMTITITSITGNNNGASELWGPALLHRLPVLMHGPAAGWV